jgi:hypothetical protein
MEETQGYNLPTSSIPIEFSITRCMLHRYNVHGVFLQLRRKQTFPRSDNHYDYVQIIDKLLSQSQSRLYDLCNDD